MPGQAVAALLGALAHVRRHHLDAEGTRSRSLPAMVVLNLLRELDTLLRHAIVEVSGPQRGGMPGDRRGAWRPHRAALASGPGERRDFAAVTMARNRLSTIGFAASAHPCTDVPAPEDLAATLATAVALTDAITRRLCALATADDPPAPLPLAG